MRNELILKPDPAMDAAVTVIPVVLVFLTASVCVRLAPTATVPNDTVDGEEVSAVPCAASANRNDAAQAANKAARKEKYRWEGPPG